MGMEAMFPTETIVAMDKLERLIHMDDAVKAFVTPYVAKVLADLSIVAEGLRNAHNYHPWAKMVFFQSVEKRRRVQE